MTTAKSFSDLARQLADLGSIHGKLASSSAKMKRGMVWCRKFGHSQRIDTARNAGRLSWPTCCGQTMTIDSPEER